MKRLPELDPLLHNRLRLAVISLLAGVEEAEFTWLQEQAGATAGNLSIQIGKLKDAGYIEVTKRFRGNYPQTSCNITDLGRQRFEEYVKALQNYFNR